MKIISTATTLTNAFKNVGRLNEIIRVFFMHGFADLIQRAHLGKFLPKRVSQSEKFQSLPIEVRLRMSFEQLGPTFIKFGQLLASRPDLIPIHYVEEFQKLQDQVQPSHTPELKEYLEAEFKKPLSQIFSSFDEIPMAAASIGQVHAATLANGEEVIVKIQRPGVEKILHQDISILRGIAALLEKYIPEVKIFNPTGIVEEFFKTLLFETDYKVEANNIRKIKANFEDSESIHIPKVYDDLCTSKVIVQERLRGIKFSERETIIEQGFSVSDIVEKGAEAFFKMVMQDGLFHGDLHAGNLFVLADGKIGIIDFGIVGRLSLKVRDGIIAIFVALVEEDFETLAVEYLNICQTTQEPNLTLLQKDLMDAISPYIGMSLGEVNIGSVLMRSTAIATKHHLQVPRELMLLFKAIFSLEGLGKKLDPQFDLLSLGTSLAKETLKMRYSLERLIRDFLIVGRDVQILIESGPRLLRRFLKRFSENQFRIETSSKDIRELATQVHKFSGYFLLSIFCVCLYALGITFIIQQIGPQVFKLPVYGIIPITIATLLMVQKIWFFK